MAFPARLILVWTLASSIALAQTAAPSPPPGATPFAAATAPPATAPPATAPPATVPPATVAAPAVTATAAPAPAPPPAYMYASTYAVPVDVIGTEPGLSFTISDKDGRPIAECPGNCRLQLLPGRYKVFVHETENTLAGARNVDIQGPTTLRVDPDTREHRGAGLVMGIVGPILMIVGIAVLMSSACEHDCGPGDKNYDDTQTASSAGILTFLGGAGMAAGGWVMYGTSFKPEIEVDTGARRAARATRGGLGRDAILGVRFTF